ncbi:protein YgfX [Pseudomonas sp.]|uniref:protein YgfX n=1 Tax=Pseudomonas sp. TaxID=306 RepID=UPI003A969CB7
MSSQSSRFEFRWQSSVLLRAFYLSIQLLALIALWVVDLPFWASAGVTLLCALHAAWVFPRSVSLSAPAALTALRRVEDDWQLWSDARGWQSIQLLPDSLALPWLIVLRFCWVNAPPGHTACTQMAHAYASHTICIPCDAMAAAEHRRFRVRLKFSQRRWVVAE